MVIASWDAEEQGLIGSTEWAEEHAPEMEKAVAYFNMDVGAGGPNFDASSVPALKQFIREVTKEVPSQTGSGTVYDVWKAKQAERKKESGGQHRHAGTQTECAGGERCRGRRSGERIGLHPVHPAPGSALDGHRIGRPYGVYHSAFDDFNWYVKFGDPEFKVSQQQARVYGVQLMRMADADVLPYDYQLYGKEISAYIEKASGNANQMFGEGSSIDAAAATAANVSPMRERKLLAKQQNGAAMRRG